MSILAAFNNRARFVNPDGTLTPEASRLLEILRERVGSTLGDMGADVFAPFVETARVDGTPVVQPSSSIDALPEMVMQSVPSQQQPADVVQPLNYSAGTALSLVNMQFALKDTAVAPGTYGDGTHVAQFTVDQQGRLIAATSVAIAFPGGANFTGSFTGKTVTVTNGLITSVV